MAGRDTPVYGSVAAARTVGISLRQLYYWIQILHAVRPHMQRHGKRMFARLTAQDVQMLKAVKRLMERGYTLRAAIDKVR